MPGELIQAEMTEFVRNAQPEKLLVTRPGPFPRHRKWQVCVGEEVIQGRHGLLPLCITTGVGTQCDLGLEHLGAFSGVGEGDVVGAADLLVTRLGGRGLVLAIEAAVAGVV